MTRTIVAWQLVEILPGEFETRRKRPKKRTVKPVHEHF